MKRLRVKEALSAEVLPQQVLIKGWVRTQRESKGFCFLEINDGSCLANLQCIAADNLIDYNSDVLRAKNGASVSLEGKLVESPGKGQKVEVQVEKLKLLGESDPETYPLQKKKHSLEFLRTIAHLRPRTNTFGATFRLRSLASFAIHKFFHERGFIYLHSPIITTSDCEGAGAMFQVTTLDFKQIPRINNESSAAIDFSKDFFGAPASLTVSGQLEGELVACALGNVYSFGPTFRAENSNTPRHLAEFWMIEPEMAFCDLAGDADLAEEFIKYVVSYVLAHGAEDMAFFEKWVEPGILSALEKIVTADFARMTYTEAIDVLRNSGKTFEFPIVWGSDIQTEHERYLSEEYVGRPVFVTNYPKEIKAFYMRLDEGEKTVAAMDLLVPRVGEIIGGSQREERGDVLLRRIKECGLPEENYWWYLDTRKFGTVPHAGFGLGFERLMMYLTGVKNVRDIIPFPRTPGNAEF